MSNCKHLQPDGRCDMTKNFLGIKNKMCDYIEFDKDETQFCYYYESPVMEILKETTVKR